MGVLKESQVRGSALQWKLIKNAQQPSLTSSGLFPKGISAEAKPRDTRWNIQLKGAVSDQSAWLGSGAIPIGSTTQNLLCEEHSGT